MQRNAMHNATCSTLFAPSRNERARERKRERARESSVRSIKAAAARTNRGTVTETSADSAINIHTSLTTELRRRCVCYECKSNTCICIIHSNINASILAFRSEGKEQGGRL